MLKKQNRITNKKDFDRAFKAGQSFYGKVVGLKLVINNLTHNRFGIIISAKVSKKAVERNRIRRSIREEIKNFLNQATTGQDFVFIVHPETNKLKPREIRLIINNLLTKAGQIDKNKA